MCKGNRKRQSQVEFHCQVLYLFHIRYGKHFAKSKMPLILRKAIILFIYFSFIFLLVGGYLLYNIVVVFAIH